MSLLWNKVWSDCQNFSDEAMESPPVTIAINETRLVHISQQSTKGSLFFSIQTEPLVGQNDSICNEPAPVYSFCQRLSYFFLNRDGTGTPKPNMTAEAGKTVHISKAITSTTVMTLPLGCNLSNGTAIGKFLHYLQDKRGTFVTSSKMPEQLTHSYSSVNGSGNVSTECTSEYLNMCGVCVPKCSSTHRYLPTISGETIEENMLIAACVVAIFGEIVFIVLALIRRNEMYVSDLDHHHNSFVMIYTRFMILHYHIHSTHSTVTVLLLCFCFILLDEIQLPYIMILKITPFGNFPLCMMCFVFWSLT